MVSRLVITLWSKDRRTNPLSERNKVSVSIREGGRESISHVTLAKEEELKTWPGSFLITKERVNRAWSKKGLGRKIRN